VRIQVVVGDIDPEEREVAVRAGLRQMHGRVYREFLRTVCVGGLVAADVEAAGAREDRRSGRSGTSRTRRSRCPSQAEAWEAAVELELRVADRPAMPRLISAFMIPATESPGETQRCRSLPHRSVTWMSPALGTVVSGDSRRRGARARFRRLPPPR